MATSSYPPDLPRTNTLQGHRFKASAYRYLAYELFESDIFSTLTYLTSSRTSLQTMPPDLNSLPPSRSTSSSPMQTRAVLASAPTMEPLLHRRETPSPLSSSVSLAAAATMNAADISRRNSAAGSGRGSPRAGRASERRRSVVAINLNLNDPSIPGPGELPSSDHRSSISHSFVAASPSTLGGTSTVATGDPHHHQRNPSLGEIHQELEQEQEAQVNRLLQMIRMQQLQLEQMQRYQQEHNSRHASHGTAGVISNNSAAIDDSTPISDGSFSLPHPNVFPPLPRPVRRSSRGQSSSGTSPALRPLPGREASHNSSGDFGPPSPIEIARRNSSRDESAFYQAETANLTRENQMLRVRIRELERQVSEMNPNAQANAPPVPSNLVTSSPVTEEDDVSTTPLVTGEMDKE